LASRPASTRNQLLAIGVVVVRQLFAGVDITRGADPDRLSDDVAVTIRLTGVVDEAREIAVNIGIAHPAAVDGETPDAPLRQVLRLALQALLVIDQLACVIDDARIFCDWFGGEDAPSVDVRAAPYDSRNFRFT